MRIQLRVAGVVALMLAGLLAGCGSSRLSIHVDRYDLDRKPPVRKGVAAFESPREAYERLNPRSITNSEMLAKLENARATVMQYRDEVEAVNRVAAALWVKIFEASKTVLPPEQLPAGRAAAVHETFRPVIARIDSHIDDLRQLVAKGKGSATSAVAVAPIAALIDGLPAELDKQELVGSAKKVQETADAIRQSGAQIFKTAAAELDTEIQALSDNPETRARLLAIKSDLTTGARPGAESIKKLESVRRAARERFDELNAVRGDVITHLHTVYQDMSDPFLVYIAAHPTFWQPLPNSATVRADADSEFVLVMDDALDARFKSIYVDPAKVVAAQSRIARRITAAIATAAGIASTAFGVPIPATLLGTKGSAQDAEIDYSRLSAEQMIAKERNRHVRARIDSIRGRSAALLSGINDRASGQRAAEEVSRAIRALTPRDEPAEKPANPQ